MRSWALAGPEAEVCLCWRGLASISPDRPTESNGGRGGLCTRVSGLKKAMKMLTMDVVSYRSFRIIANTTFKVEE
jgi:hypothetical protein